MGWPTPDWRWSIDGRRYYEKDAEHLHGFLRALALRDAALGRIRAGGLQARSLVYWGADDPQVPLALGLPLYEALRAGPAPAALHVIDDAGHFPFAEHPGEFDRAVGAF